MKKWLFVLGVFGCCGLFFISGTLVGYLTSEKMAQSSELSDKPTRKPSEKLNPIIGRIVRTQTTKFTNKTRRPTPDAVLKAKRYKMELMG